MLTGSAAPAATPRQPLSSCVADKNRHCFHVSRNTPDRRSLPTSDPALVARAARGYRLPSVHGKSLHPERAPLLQYRINSLFDLLGAFLALSHATFHSRCAAAVKNPRLRFTALFEAVISRHVASFFPLSRDNSPCYTCGRCRSVPPNVLSPFGGLTLRPSLHWRDIIVYLPRVRGGAVSLSCPRRGRIPA